MESKPKIKKNLKFRYFIIASVLAHILFFAVVILSNYAQHTSNKPELIEISFEDAKPKQKIPTPKLIVDSDSATANNELSDDAKFLSDKNNKTEKQTKAKNGAEFHNIRKFSREVKKQKAQNSKPKLFDNGFDAYASLSKKEMIAQKKQAGDRLNQSSTTNDNLENIQDDLMTRLNTREYKYFTYYSRIKKQLNQWWVPKVQQKFTKLLRQGRTIASEENKVTKLVIILNRDGLLVNVRVLAASGVRDLDDAAVEAFRQAAPFPNPPKGMIERDGTVKIRWDCVVES